MDYYPEGCECKRRTRTSDVSHHAQTHPDHGFGLKPEHLACWRTRGCLRQRSSV